MITGKWMVLDASTREVFGIFQDGNDAIQVCYEHEPSLKDLDDTKKHYSFDLYFT
jgi:hypothetical protein